MSTVDRQSRNVGEAPPKATDARSDSGLRCPHCEYNLTGLDTSRCPECGHHFDPELLRRIRAGEPQPISVWDDATLALPLRFALTCLLTWFRPVTFARRFPARYSVASARCFRWLAFAAALGVYWFGILTSGAWTLHRATVMSTVGVSIGGFVGMITCETLAWGIASALLRRRDGRLIAQYAGSSNSWQGLIAFHRSFLIISAALVSIPPHLMLPPVLLRFGTLNVLAVASSVWWWACLGRCLAVHAEPGAWRVLGIALLPLALLAGIATGAAAGVIAGFLLYVSGF